MWEGREAEEGGKRKRSKRKKAVLSASEDACCSHATAFRASVELALRGTQPGSCRLSLLDSLERNASQIKGQRRAREQRHGARPRVALLLVLSFFSASFRHCFRRSRTSQSNSVAGGDDEGIKIGALGLRELMACW